MSGGSADPEPVEDVHGDARWISLHNRFLIEAKEKEPDVLFIGDSLIQHMVHHEVWRQLFEPLHALNFGIGGDQTQNLLWRVMNGELEYIQPKAVVLLIGTNNHAHTAKEVTDGIIAIVDVIQEKLPSSHVIVIGLPPRGLKPNHLREKIATINSILTQELDARPQLSFLNTDPALFIGASSSEISYTDMYDYLHLTNRGYEKLIEPLIEELQAVLKTYLKVPSETSSMAGDLALDHDDVAN